MTAERLRRRDCCGIMIDVQDYFLSLIENSRQAAIRTNLANFVQLLDYFGIPLLVTLERPVTAKGGLPEQIASRFGEATARYEKSFFDLTKEAGIRMHLAGLKRRQVLLAGCETDVCVLQSCLGLIELGYEVFVVEELVFSASPDVRSALMRMQRAGTVFLSYKSLYYELLEAVEGGRHGHDTVAASGAFPDHLPDGAVE